jgi:hypothetical protein
MTAEERKLSDHKRTAAIRKWFHAYKATLSCFHCELDFKNQIYLCDFHHVDPNSKEVKPSMMVSQRWSKVRILKELAKCIPLCANCHRHEHFGGK